MSDIISHLKPSWNISGVPSSHTQDLTTITDHHSITDNRHWLCPQAIFIIFTHTALCLAVHTYHHWLIGILRTLLWALVAYYHGGIVSVQWHFDDTLILFAACSLFESITHTSLPCVFVMCFGCKFLVYDCRVAVPFLLCCWWHYMFGFSALFHD